MGSSKKGGIECRTSLMILAYEKMVPQPYEPEKFERYYRAFSGIDRKREDFITKIRNADADSTTTLPHVISREVRIV